MHLLFGYGVTGSIYFVFADATLKDTEVVTLAMGNDKKPEKLSWRSEVLQSHSMRWLYWISYAAAITLVIIIYQIYSTVTRLQEQHRINTACFSGHQLTKCKHYEK